MLTLGAVVARARHISVAQAATAAIGIEDYLEQTWRHVTNACESLAAIDGQPCERWRAWTMRATEARFVKHARVSGGELLSAADGAWDESYYSEVYDDAPAWIASAPQCSRLAVGDEFSIAGADHCITKRKDTSRHHTTNPPASTQLVMDAERHDVVSVDALWFCDALPRLWDACAAGIVKVSRVIGLFDPQQKCSDFEALWRGAVDCGLAPTSKTTRGTAVEYEWRLAVRPRRRRLRHVEEWNTTVFGCHANGDIAKVSDSFVRRIFGRSVTLQADDAITAPKSTDILFNHVQTCNDVDIKSFPGVVVHLDGENGRFMKDFELRDPSKSIYVGCDVQEAYDKVGGATKARVHSLRVIPAAIFLFYDDFDFFHGPMTFSHALLRGRRDLIRALLTPLDPTREYFLTYVSSRCLPHRERAYDVMVDFAAQHGFKRPVAFGNCHGSHPETAEKSGETGSGHKFDGSVAHMNRNARFVLVMENSDVDFYVTEKILHAFLAGCVPIYWGTRTIFRIFNPKAFVFFDMDDPQPALDHVARLETDPDLYLAMLREPVLRDGDATLDAFFSLAPDVGRGSLRRRFLALLDAALKPSA